MGVSFTISKKGKRYRSQSNSVKEHKNDKRDQYFHGDGTPSAQPQNLNQASPIIHCSSASLKSSALFKSTLEQLKEFDPSFLLNLYDDGFTFEKYTNEFCNDVPINLNPYDLHTEPILTDIEYGCISTGIPLDDMQCKYVNGTILCEVRDYRVFIEFPVINQVPLKMTLASLHKDMLNMSEQISYGDGLEFESRVLESMHPFLNLEPTPVQEFGLENKPLIKLIDWDIISKKRRIDTSHNLNPLKSFQMINMVTQRFMLDIAQMTWSDPPFRTTPFNFPELVGAHLRGEGPDYSIPKSRGTNEGTSFNPLHPPYDCQSLARTSQNYFPPFASSIPPRTGFNPNISYIQ